MIIRNLRYILLSLHFKQNISILLSNQQNIVHKVLWQYAIVNLCKTAAPLIYDHVDSLTTQITYF